MPPCRHAVAGKMARNLPPRGRDSDKAVIARGEVDGRGRPTTSRVSSSCGRLYRPIELTLLPVGRRLYLY